MEALALALFIIGISLVAFYIWLVVKPAFKKANMNLQQFFKALNGRRTA